MMREKEISARDKAMGVVTLPRASTGTDNTSMHRITFACSLINDHFDFLRDYLFGTLLIHPRSLIHSINRAHMLVLACPECSPLSPYAQSLSSCQILSIGRYQKKVIGALKIVFDSVIYGRRAASLRIADRALSSVSRNRQK
jgi:hypothetical protein